MEKTQTFTSTILTVTPLGCKNSSNEKLLTKSDMHTISS